MAKLKFPPADHRYIADYPVTFGEAEADPIVSHAVRIVTDGTGGLPVTDTDTDLVIETVQVQSPVVIARISGGTPGQNYRVEFEVVLTSGQRFNQEITLPVKNL